jgi:hypothetical protein
MTALDSYIAEECYPLGRDAVSSGIIVRMSRSILPLMTKATGPLEKSGQHMISQNRAAFILNAVRNSDLTN